MYQDFKDLYPLPPMVPEQPKEKEYYRLPIECLYPGSYNTQAYNMLGTEIVITSEFTGWRDECLAQHLTCTITNGLSKMPTTRISGPDAKKFLKKAFINKFEKFPINSSKHATMVTKEGLIVQDGVLFRLDEDLYEISNCSPYLDFLLATEGSGLDIKVENLSASKTIFQLQGPSSLQVVEEALGMDIHDLKFNKIIQTKWHDIDILIVRFGMGAILGYEVHCYQSDCEAMAEALLTAGTKYGIRRLGTIAYMMSHCPGGSMQCSLSAGMALTEDKEFVEWFSKGSGLDKETVMIYLGLGNVGSLAAEDMAETYANPFEMGLGAAVDLENPDLRGREVLTTYSKNPKRKMVTLKWNRDDLIDIYASAFTEGAEQPYEQFDNPRWNYYINGGIATEFNRVLDKNGNKIGFSGGRTIDVYNRAMVSFAIMNVEETELGNEVQVVWGRPGSRQKLVHAVVVETPFNRHLFNKTFDVETIPHLTK